jgi:hypothetical protein
VSVHPQGHSTRAVELLRTADVPPLAVFVTAAQQDDDLPAMKSVIKAQAGTESDSQLKSGILIDEELSSCRVQR